jgi:wyosine [tRNA(Phe)-imidazoG37] synthetase (radical SAM superfamily)
MAGNNGETWAKLDAGTETYYRKVNRPNFPLTHVVANIIAASKVRPIVVQSIFMRMHDQPPDEAELLAYTDRLNEITQAGGKIDYVQVYTIARRPAEDYVTGLTDQEVDRIAGLVRTRTSLRARAFYGPG